MAIMGVLGRLAAFFFDNPLGKLVGGALALAALVGWFGWEQRSIGRATERAAIEKVTKDAAKHGGLAARKSADERVRGQRDPSTRDE